MNTLNLKQVYDTNADFHNYVDRYSVSRGISVETALTHALVKEIVTLYAAL